MSVESQLTSPLCSAGKTSCSQYLARPQHNLTKLDYTESNPSKQVGNSENNPPKQVDISENNPQKQVDNTENKPHKQFENTENKPIKQVDNTWQYWD